MKIQNEKSNENTNENFEIGFYLTIIIIFIFHFEYINYVQIFMKLNIHAKITWIM